MGGVGVYCIKDGKILCGCRGGSWSLCGPGGHIEDGESPEEAAVREAQEEFSITPKDMILVGRENSGLKPYVFLCTEWDGDPKTDNDEMYAPGFLSLDEIYRNRNVFPAFLNGCKMIEEAVKGFRTDGAPYGNKNAAGPHKKGAGKYINDDNRTSLESEYGDDMVQTAYDLIDTNLAGGFDPEEVMIDMEERYGDAGVNLLDDIGWDMNFDSWEEGKHPRDESGKFSSSGKKISVRGIGDLEVQKSRADKVWGNIHEAKDPDGNTITISDDGHVLSYDGGFKEYDKSLKGERFID